MNEKQKIILNFRQTTREVSCKKFKDCILQVAEVYFASGVVSDAHVVSGACIVNGAEKKSI